MWKLNKKRKINRAFVSGLLIFFIKMSSLAGMDDAIRSSHLAANYAALINFASEPSISSSHLWIDDGLREKTRLGVTKFPLYHEFKLKNHEWRPFIQVTFGYLKMDQKIGILNNTETVSPTWKSYSVSSGGGVHIPLSEHWSILPAGDVGYARLRNKVHYNGPVGNSVLKPVLEGKLFDWFADTWLMNAHLSLKYEKKFEKLEVTSSVGGTYSYIQSFDSTSSFQDIRENVGSIHIKADGTYPLGLSPWGNPLFVVGHIGNTTLVGKNRNALGFSSVNEVGLSLLVDFSQYEWKVKRLSIGLMGLWGNDVYGWSLLTTYSF
jgi:hypothetical protein